MLTPFDFRWLVLDYRKAREAKKRGEEPLRHPPMIIEILADGLRDIANVYKGSDPDALLEPVVRHAGYLASRRGDWSVFVPWPLARYFPTWLTLSEILAFGP